MRLLFAIFTCVALLTPRTSAAQSSALHTLLHDIFEDQLKRSPEFASAIGDPRYDDQLSDLSPRAFNDGIAAEQGFLQRLLMVDTTNLADDDKLAADQVQRELTADIEVASSKPWQLPITPSHAIQSDLAALANGPFTTVKEYDDYIARLHLIPRQLRQASENLLAGIDANRVQPADLVQKALKQTEEFAAQTPETSVFANPLKKFPATIPAASRKRIAAETIDAIQTDVLPAYARFAKFLRVTELPPAQKEHEAIDPSAGLASVALEIQTLRSKSEAALGPKFNLKSFHDMIVTAWPLPPQLLNQRVDAWIAANK